MSADDDELAGVVVSPITNRRERRIHIELDEKYLVRSNFGNEHKFGRSSLAAANKMYSFEAGDQLAGEVRLDIVGGPPVTKVTLALICLTQVRAVAERRRSIIEAIFNKDGRPAGEIYFEREKYLEIDLSKENGGNKFGDGKYTIPFAFTIPFEGLPSSMKSCYALIKHSLNVFTVDEDGKENRGEKEIIIVSPETKLELSIGETTEKYAHIANAGTVKLKGSLERRGYAATESIPVKVTLENNTNIDLCPRVTLYQTQAFIHNQQHRSIETCLNEVGATGELVEAGQSLAQIITIPLPTNLVVSLRSALILVRYSLHIALDVPNMHELYVSLPFVVTTKRALEQKLRQQKSIKRKPTTPTSPKLPSSSQFIIA